MEQFTQTFRQRRTKLIETSLNVLLAAATVAAVAALICEYGFRTPIVNVGLLHAAEALVVAIFAVDRFIRLMLATRKKHFLRENMVDFLLMAVALVVTVINFNKVLSAGAFYVLITQAYILSALVLRGVGLNLRFAGSGIHPSVLLIGSFAVMIFVGSGLLMLPVSVQPEFYGNWYYGDALFTSTSATCVTGLVVRDTGTHFTPFGQAIILALIQFGGLGFMLFGTVLGLLMGKALSMRQTEAIGQMISTENIGRISRVAMFVIFITFAFELAGAISLYPMFAGTLDAGGDPLTKAGAVWYSAFHSISAFCNAGFALYGNNMMQGVREGWDAPLRNNWQIMGVIAPLIVLGGLGFPVLQDCGRYMLVSVKRLAARYATRQSVIPRIAARPRLMLHSKIVLTTSIALIIAGACVLLLLEPTGPNEAQVGRHNVSAVGGDWPQMQTAQRVKEAIFQSITARTAGFNTIDIAELSDASKLWLCGLMTIGGSPAGTAGGMKTVTFALLILVVWSQLHRRNQVEAFRRNIPVAVIGRSVTVAVLYSGLLAMVVMLLCVAQGPGYNFIDLLFEACSACGTVGLSTGVTASLNEFGKSVIVAGMFAGRLGPLTLLAVLTLRLRRANYTYPTESVING